MTNTNSTNNSNTKEKQTLANFDIYSNTRQTISDDDKKIIKNYFKIFEYENTKTKNNWIEKQKQTIKNTIKKLRKKHDLKAGEFSIEFKKDLKKYFQNIIDQSNWKISIFDLQSILQYENYLKKENLIHNYSLEFEIKSNANDMINTFDDFELWFYLANKASDDLIKKFKTLDNWFNKIFLCKQINKAMLNTYNNEMTNPDTWKLDFSIISEWLVSREPTPLEYVNNLYIENNEYIQNTINKIQVLKTKYTKTKSSNYKKQIEKEKENLKNFVYTI